MSDNRFAAIPTAALEDERITSTDIAVLAALARFADRHGWCYPKQDDLARLSRVRRETVNRRIRELCKMGYVQKTNRTLPGRGKVGNQYRVVFDIRNAEPDQAHPETVVIQDHNAQSDLRSQRGRCDPPITADVIPRSHPYKKHPNKTHTPSLRSGVDAREVRSLEVSRPKRREPAPKSPITQTWMPNQAAIDFARNEMGMSNDQIRRVHAEFIDFWTGESNTKRGKKSQDGWNRTFKDRVETVASRWKTKPSNQRGPANVVDVMRSELERGAPVGDWF